MMHLKISDTGIGMDEGQLSRLTDVYNQADSSITRRFGGTGLGLSISLRLIEAMNGGFSVSSETDRGTVFNVFVPLCRSAEVKQAASNMPGLNVLHTGQKRKMRVLLVEDDVVNAEVATAILKMRGHDVVHVTDGQLAVDSVQSHAFDLVLMDVQMPNLSGPDATRNIRALGGAYAKLPIIALTASAMAGDKEALLASGMNDYLSKPFRKADFIRLLDQYAARNDETERVDSPLPDWDEPYWLENFGLLPSAKSFLTAGIEVVEFEIQNLKSPRLDKDIQKSLHRLSGTLGTLGYLHFSDWCKAKEIKIREDSHANPDELESFVSVVQELSKALEVILPTLRQRAQLGS
jgi:CheY-like chemotaxis protein